MACGFYPVEFADFWLADQLNSLVVLFLDSEFMICFYAINGVTTRDTVELGKFQFLIIFVKKTLFFLFLLKQICIYSIFLKLLFKFHPS